MQVVFLNQFERVTGHADERAQVFIGELQGVWSVGWRALQGSSETEVQDLWYEGMSWEELLAAFRHGVAVKLKEGFRPLLDGMLEEVPFWERRQALPQLLQCYADSREAEEAVSTLRAWRRAKAIEEKKSAYLIATNREVQLLAVYLPHTLAELGQIPGFGKVKTEKYGAEIVSLLQGMERKHSYPLHEWVPQAVSADQLSAWMFRLQEEKYGKKLAIVKEKRTLLEGIRDGRTLAQLESDLKCARRMLVERIERLDEEGYDVLPLVERELGELPEEEAARIEEAIGELGDRYLKPLLRKVYGEASSADEAEAKYEKLRMVRIRRRRAAAQAI
ncbi:HRDC domain-containing protein [Cohnella hongkongensis]|uniref:HRDC domain-containing protein n=1 Tax=Cohnella hongkongensis TaxID=178337 RepID=A0ABV9FCD0_9BACL